MTSPLDASSILSHIPSTLRNELILEYQKITRNYRELRWEATELDGGRFAEVAYTILAGYLDGGNYPATASKPQRFDQACKQLESASSSTYPKSARVTIPRVLVSLYDIRNNRGVGHVGGDVSANHMDSAYVLNSSKWVIAEFVRIFHSTDLATATATVDALMDRTIPLVWQVGNITRVLDPKMSLKNATLVLLYSNPKATRDTELGRNLEQSRMSNYRRVLRSLHESRLVEYKEQGGDVTLSPLGIMHVEDNILPKSIT